MRKFVLAAVAATVFCAPPVLAGTYTFAGVTFEQDSTPDQLGLLGNGAVLGGATFSANTVNTITQSVGFLAEPGGSSGSGFTPVAGFDASLSLGRLAYAPGVVEQSGGGTCLFACAVNMPRSNLGGTRRHGLELGWSGGRTLGNGAGGDFVLYESGSNSTSPEHTMIRVRLTDGSYSPWRFESNDGYEIYENSPATVTGAFATVYDLSDFGLGAGDAIDQIQIATILTTDLWDSTTGVFGFDGSGSIFSSSGDPLDPDPLYLGVLHALTGPVAVDAPSALAAFGVGLAALGLFRRRRRD